MWITWGKPRWVLQQMGKGATLKAHRYLNGQKVFRLHLLDGTIHIVSERTMRRLKKQQFIESNMKFPAATYVLTARGKQPTRTACCKDTGLRKSRANLYKLNQQEL